MSILAQITVVECDGCKELTTLTNDVERESFDKLWLRKKDKDLCVLCREKEEFTEQENERVMARLVSKINRKYGAAVVQMEG